MSLIKQVLISLLVIVFAGLGWFAFSHRDLVLSDLGIAAGAGEGPSAAPGSAGPGQTSGGGGSGGGSPAASAGGGRSGGGGFGRGPSAAPVIAAAVDIQTTGDRLTAIGTLAAVQEVTVFPQVDGIVAAIDFKPGGHATSGQTLVKLYSKDLEVIVDRAGVALDDAKDALDRAQRLAKTNNMTLADLQTARVNERKAEIDLQVAQLALNKRTISAPFDGTIGLTDLSVGDFVTSSKAIATLDDMTTLTVDFQVPERFAGLLAVGHDLSATAESVSGEKFAGKVMAIDSRIDEATRSLKMKASFPNQSGVLKPGMAVTVSIDFPGQPHPVVPSLAIQWDRQGAFVWKLAGDAVHRTGVTILDRSGRDVSVIGDLAKDDQVIVQGVQSLREGAKVARIDDGGAAPAAKAAPAAGVPEASDGDAAKRLPQGQGKPGGKDQAS